MKCPGCGSENTSGARYCEGCGTVLEMVEASGTARLRRRAVLTGEREVLAAAETVPLGTFSDGFAALPEGAILGHRYVVRELRVVGEAHNVYLAEDLVAVRRCPVCRASAQALSERYCATCGADLASTEAVTRRYLVQERRDVEAFTTERQLLSMQLAHPGLLLPLDVFSEAPYGPPRAYRVTPEFSPPLVQSLGLPQGWQVVVLWGIALAEAMAHLHQHQIVVRAVDVGHIAVDGERAMWAGLDAVSFIPPAERGATTPAFAEDLRRLAATLVRLLTATTEPRAEPDLPDALRQLLAEAHQHPETLTAQIFAQRLAAFLNDARPAPRFALAVGYRTDVGSVRELNEDSLLVLDLGGRDAARSSMTSGLFLVADGMGGYDAGEVASEMACEVIGSLVRRQAPPVHAASQGFQVIAEWLIHAVEAANLAVYEARRAADSEMGTTLVAALVSGTSPSGGLAATVANVGDSRCYHLNGTSIRRVTTDHSLVERLVATGQITALEAANHPQRNVITRAIGDRSQVEVDVFSEVIAMGEALLLCSDGLSGMVADERLFQLWRTSVSPQEACDRLVEAAVQAGGEDNITAIIVQTVAV